MVVPDGEPGGRGDPAAVDGGARLVLTTGGTGLTPTDRTPEVTRALLDLEVPGHRRGDAGRRRGQGRAHRGAVPRAGRRGRDLPGGQPAGLARRGEGRASRSCATSSCTRSSRSWGATIEPRQAAGRRGSARAPTRWSRCDRCGCPTSAAWRSARQRNASWLVRVGRHGAARRRTPRATTFRALVRRLRAAARRGTTYPFAVEVDGAFAGQLSDQQHRAGVGAVRVGRLLAGPGRSRAAGVMPRAVAMAIDHCFFSGRPAPASRSASGRRTPTRCGSWRSSGSARSASRRGSCTSTGPGATTGSTRSPGGVPGRAAQAVRGVAGRARHRGR